MLNSTVYLESLGVDTSFFPFKNFEKDCRKGILKPCYSVKGGKMVKDRLQEITNYYCLKHLTIFFNINNLFFDLTADQFEELLRMAQADINNILIID